MKTALMLVAVAFLLVSCGDDANAPREGSRDGTWRVTEVNVHGRDITCIAWSAGYAGGLSCDWRPQ